MKSVNLFVPQWQDSGSSAELYDGAVFLREHLEGKSRLFKKKSFYDIPVDLNSSLETEKNVYGYRMICDQLE